MKTSPATLKHRAASGIFLIECLVYIAVFGVMFTVASGAFYHCWDYSKALNYQADDMAAIVRAGECWRADVRAAFDDIKVQKTSTGEVLRLTQKKQVVLYRFEAGELSREIPAHGSRVVLAKIKTSTMQADHRGDVTAWRWDVELESRRQEMQMPLAFTFEAVPHKL